MMILGLSSNERAIATVCRCPPESDAIGSRTEGIRAASSLSRVQARTSICDLVQPVGRHLVAEEQVGDDVEIFAEREILEDRGDAHVERRGRIAQRHLPTVELDRSRRRLMDAGQYLDQRGLAGAVVADKCDYLSRMHVEFDVSQRRYRAEILADVAQAENWLAFLRASAVSSVIPCVLFSLGRSSRPEKFSGRA